MHNKKCQKCGNSFLTVKKTRKYCSEKCFHDSKKVNKNEYFFECKKCKKQFSVFLTEGEYLKNRYKKYCSRKCSNSRIFTDEIKDKISESLIKYADLKGRVVKKEIVKKERIKKERTIKTLICTNCGSEFESFHKKQCCSVECATKRSREGGIKGSQNTKQQKRSKNEVYFSELCENDFKNIKLNESIFNGWDADVILDDYKLAILWNGNWHYKKLAYNHSLSQVQNRDRIKIKEIIKCGYEPYIIKDEGRFNKKFVEQKYNELLVYLKK